MSLVVNAFIVSISMLFIFFLAFLMVYLLALFLSPIERSLSKIVWDMTKPPAPTPVARKGSFKDFSKKH